MWADWAMMSILMMSPLVLIVSWRQKRGPRFLLASFVGFVAVWIVAGLPAIAIVDAASSLNSIYVTFALCGVAGAYQFSQLHDHAVNQCMNVADSTGITHGIRVAWNCVLACGPLMVAAFWVMPTTIAPMVALAVLMIFEFVSSHNIFVSRGMGLAAGIFAFGVLFLAGPMPDVANLVIHQHG